MSRTEDLPSLSERWPYLKTWSVSRQYLTEKARRKSVRSSARERNRESTSFELSGSDRTRGKDECDIPGRISVPSC